MAVDRRRPRAGASTGKRLLWLVLCVAGGATGAAIGFALTGLQAWVLAVPAAVAAGWLVFGTPQDCGRPEGATRRAGQGPAPSPAAADNAGSKAKDTR